MTFKYKAALVFISFSSLLSWCAALSGQSISHEWNIDIRRFPLNTQITAQDCFLSFSSGRFRSLRPVRERPQRREGKQGNRQRGEELNNQQENWFSWKGFHFDKVLAEERNAVNLHYATPLCTETSANRERERKMNLENRFLLFRKKKRFTQSLRWEVVKIIKEENWFFFSGG